MEEKLLLIQSMMRPGHEWDDDDPDLSELIKDVMKLYTNHEPIWFECGSFTLKDTPKALYRALHLFGPKEVDFRDMYKCNLFGIVSADGRFSCSLVLFKYELGVYCYTSDSDAVAGKKPFVRGGWPGCDNGRHCIDEVGLLFFDVVKALLNYTHGVYPGNNFEV